MAGAGFTRGGNYRYIIYDSRIHAMFGAGGLVWDEGRKLSRDVHARAKATAPMRTGNLKRSLGVYINREAKTGLNVGLYSTASYADVVNRGYTGRIYPTNPSGKLWVRPAPHSWYSRVTPRDSVKGQHANPFMARAVASVTAWYGVPFIAP